MPIIVLFMLMCSSCSSCISSTQMGLGGLGSGGGFAGGFFKGVTDPVGATNDLVNAAQGKNPGISEASPQQECKIKCGDTNSCTNYKKDVAAGTLPANLQDKWDWCSGNITPSVHTTSKEKFGTPCCT